MPRPDQSRDERPFFSSVAPESLREFGNGGLAVTAAPPIDRPHILGISRATALTIGIVLVHVVLAWIVRTPGFGWGEDNAAFYLLARDLQSFQYRDFHDVLAPVHARFPPVFPALLALVGMVTGNSIDAMLVFVGVCSAVSIVLLYDAARRNLGEDIALLMAALYALNHTALGDAGSLMSEAPFKMFIALTLWGASRDAEGPRYAAIAVAGAVLAALTRSAGVVLLPALAVFWLLKRRYAWVFGLAVASTIVVAWLWFTFNAPDAADRRLYVADLRGGADDSVMHELMERVKRFVPRMRRYMTDLVPWTISTPTISGTIVDNVFWLAVTLLLGLLGAIALAKQWTLAALFLLVYGALVLIWRFSFERLIQPLVPLIFAVLLLGCAAAVRRYPHYRSRALLTLGALLGIGALQSTGRLVAGRLACDRSAPADSATCWPEPERELLTLAGWIRDSTPSDAILFVSKERAFYVHSGRKSINQDGALVEDSASIGEYLRSRGVTYTVLTPIGVRAYEHSELLAKSCREFELVRQVSSRTALFRVLPAPAAGDTSACVATRAYLNAVARRS